MTGTNKRSLISESVMMIQIDVHPAGDEPDQHNVRLASWVSRMTTVRESVLSQAWAPAPEMKSWPPGSSGWPSSWAASFSLQQTTFKQGGTVRESGYWATRFTGAHKTDKQSVQIKPYHRGQNDVVINRHRWGLPPRNLRIGMALSLPFPSECSTVS
jgi:hypothetical protein